MRRSWTDAQKRKMVSDWKESGLKRTEFCKKAGISLSGLDNWRKKFDVSNVRVEKKENQSKIEFLELSPSTDDEYKASLKVLRIVSSYGAVIEVPL